MCKWKIQMMGVWWCGIRLCLSGGLIIRHFDMSVASPSSNSVHESNCTCVSQWPRTLRPEAIFFFFFLFTESLQSKVNPQHSMLLRRSMCVFLSFVSSVSFFQYTFLLWQVFRWCYGSTWDLRLDTNQSGQAYYYARMLGLSYVLYPGNWIQKLSWAR